MHLHHMVMFVLFKKKSYYLTCYQVVINHIEKLKGLPYHTHIKLIYDNISFEVPFFIGIF